MKNEPVNKQLEVGDTIWSDYFNSNLKIVAINSDDDWYFELNSKIYKAQTTLSYIENNPLKAKNSTTVNKQLDDLVNKIKSLRFGEFDVIDHGKAYWTIPDSDIHKVVHLISNEREQAYAQGKDFVIKNIKKWIQGRLSNYGRNNVINALQDRIKKLTEL
jgi:hypothetical protein